ncbi:MAG: hypothetical protein HFJ50_08260 [Clostridia bacterium]|nr:hypothetical protein [Clostridia bacterium]
MEAREIEIFDISLNRIDIENKKISITVHTSKGTYIRSLCRDIAKSLRRDSVS